MQVIDSIRYFWAKLDGKSFITLQVIWKKNPSISNFYLDFGKLCLYLIVYRTSSIDQECSEITSELIPFEHHEIWQGLNADSQ